MHGLPASFEPGKRPDRERRTRDLPRSGLVEELPGMGVLRRQAGRRSAGGEVRTGGSGRGA